ncbi:hypothetical protein [Ligilactobacillus ruminis]|uniref:hypothetical protein n=1 Tax=Ligilactobacillus ruminis TaxID=1623 RepID=UPI002361D1EC|nr:hypothetical protein [Ligilactobacillus ruminis]WDC80011.1 hypothetical protein PSR47_09790 [Ligilactobacillus ruminis]
MCSKQKAGVGTMETSGMPCLRLAGRKCLSLDIGDFLELKGSFMAVSYSMKWSM